jgi:prevent-host-death family protein
VEAAMVKVTSAEMQKRFGQYSELAQREPVSITNHGRESLVLMSAAEFQRLKALDTRNAYYAHEIPEHLAEALEKAEPPGWTADLDHLMEP